MVEYTLSASKPLNGLSRGDENFHMEEASENFLYSIACHGNSVEALKSQLIAQKINLPNVGELTEVDGISMFSSGRDQWFLRSANERPRILEELRESLKEQVAITDQSDAWVQLRLSGSVVRDRLERLCALDLHPESFPVGKVARTMMEHLNVVIIRENQDVYLLMSDRSSAQSFIHMFS